VSAFHDSLRKRGGRVGAVPCADTPAAKPITINAPNAVTRLFILFLRNRVKAGPARWPVRPLPAHLRLTRANRAISLAPSDTAEVSLRGAHRLSGAFTLPQHPRRSSCVVERRFLWRA